MTSVPPTTAPQIMFETFGVAGLHVGVQSVLALYAATSLHAGGGEEGGAGSSGSSGGRGSSSSNNAAGCSSSSAGSTPPTRGSAAVHRGGTAGSTAGSTAALTGVVVDVGEGTTSVVPIVDGYVVRAGVRSMPLGGRDVTSAVLGALRCGLG